MKLCVKWGRNRSPGYCTGTPCCQVPILTCNPLQKNLYSLIVTPIPSQILGEGATWKEQVWNVNLYNQQVDWYKMKSLNRFIGGHVPKLKSKLGNKKEIGTSAVKCQISWAYSHLIKKKKKEKRKRRKDYTRSIKYLGGFCLVGLFFLFFKNYLFSFVFLGGCCWFVCFFVCFLMISLHLYYLKQFWYSPLIVAVSFAHSETTFFVTHLRIWLFPFFCCHF